jgi:hypothetical protein
VNLAGLLALEGEGTVIHKVSSAVHPMTQCQSPEGLDLQQLCCENFRSLDNYVTIHTVQTFTSCYPSEMERVMMKMMMKIVMVLMGTVVISQV